MVMDEKQERQEELLRKGRQRFLAQFGESIGKTEELVLRAQEPEARLELVRLFHSMKGSAPLFGLEQIGETAAELEQHWEEHDRDDERARELLLQLKRLGEAAASSGDAALPVSQLSETGTNAAARARLLVVDDDAAFRAYICDLLRGEGYEVDEAESPTVAKGKLRERNYDLISLDLMMGAESGFDLFEFLKSDPTLKWIPLIVLSGNSQIESKVRSLDSGADDYMTKPFEADELTARIRRLLTRVGEYQQLAFHDALTGIANRRFFDRRLRSEMDRVKRYPEPIAVAFLDIDRFKLVNDTYGHHIGDLVLQGFAHQIQRHIRASDLLARFGGEEFVVVFPNTSGLHAKRVVEELLAKLQHEPVASHDGQTYRITFSAGVAEWDGFQSIEDWLAAADGVMYRAKQEGRNRVILFDRTPPSAEQAHISNLQQQQRTVLVVDDDAILRSILVSKLGQLPVRVLEAGDGEAALRLLEKEPVDLCILDGVMPRMDGFTLLERLHEHNELASRKEDIKVLMLSARKKEDDVVRGLMLGALDYMSKPFSLVELEIRIKRLLGLIQ